jgi:predicted Holliday junction resolvase-like endonuclease
MDITTLVLGLILWLLLGMALMRILSLFEHRNIRKSAVSGSRNQIIGELYEKILPALPDFPYRPKDMVFTGKGCDYIIFDGMSEWHLREIVFLELKSGGARLTRNEEAIKYIIDHKRVRFAEYRIGSSKVQESHY